MSPRLGRRAFLKLSAAGLAGWGLPPVLAQAAPAWAVSATPSLVAALPVPFPHRLLADPDRLLTRIPPDADLLLVPAYIAAGLIRRGELQPLASPPGRAHDPEGAYTLPYRYTVSALVYPVDAAPADPWHATLAWPAFGRLMLGAALQRRGYSPNDPHPGRRALAGQDLFALRPALTADPLATLAAGRADAAFAPLVLTASNALDAPPGLAAAPPPWGGVLLEYDWVVPAHAPDPAAASAFLAGLPAVAAPPPGLRLPPLAPLPDWSQAQHTRLWADLNRARRQSGA